MGPGGCPAETEAKGASIYDRVAGWPKQRAAGRGGWFDQIRLAANLMKP